MNDHEECIPRKLVASVRAVGQQPRLGSLFEWIPRDIKFRLLLCIA